MMTVAGHHRQLSSSSTPIEHRQRVRSVLVHRQPPQHAERSNDSTTCLNEYVYGYKLLICLFVESNSSFSFVS